MKIVLNPKRHVVSDYPPAAGQGTSFGPVKKWAVIGAFILLAIGGFLFMLTVEIAVLLIVPLLAAGALYGGYRGLQNRLHRDNRPRLENK
ncbi:MAG TPA: hypothetical protein VFX02_12695 [Gammaproteobacteria bacterium]|nr:hypothetical protein [Gammaproteobacteria bacterium]